MGAKRASSGDMAAWRPSGAGSQAGVIGWRSVSENVVERGTLAAGTAGKYDHVLGV
jgi:hypothetical protein